MRLAQLVLVHRVLPQDPLGGGVEPEWLAETVEPPADGVRAAGPVDQINVF
jgi:acyl-CoA dehydrogenase